MITSVLIYLVSAFQLLFPAYLTYNLWMARYEGIDRWLVTTLTTIGVLGFLFLIGRWDIVGYALRYWLYGTYLIAAVLSGVRVYQLPFFSPGRSSGHWSTVADLIVLAVLVAWTFTGFAPESPAVDMGYPLKGESYYVAHGGSMPLLNYHGMFAESQRQALDIGRLNRWGMRATGIFPHRPDSYTIYGDTVYSPIAGTVTAVTDSLLDQHPPRRRREVPVGNHVWIRQDSLFVVLAHLKHRSAFVRTGMRVARGEPLAQVGNTGNTTAPHLHIHAVIYPGSVRPPSDSLLYRGRPVPLTFENRYLTRNDLFGASDSDLRLTSDHAQFPYKQ